MRKETMPKNTNNKFEHGSEGTHGCCRKRFKEEGGKARCCMCVPHDGCEDSQPQPKECACPTKDGLWCMRHSSTYKPQPTWQEEFQRTFWPHPTATEYVDALAIEVKSFILQVELSAVRRILEAAALGGICPENDATDERQWAKAVEKIRKDAVEKNLKKD